MCAGWLIGFGVRQRVMEARMTCSYANDHHLHACSGKKASRISPGIPFPNIPSPLHFQSPRTKGNLPPFTCDEGHGPDFWGQVTWQSDVCRDLSRKTNKQSHWLDVLGQFLLSRRVVFTKTHKVKLKRSKHPSYSGSKAWTFWAPNRAKAFRTGLIKSSRIQ